MKINFVFPGNNGVLQFGGTKIERVPVLYAIMSKFYKMNKLGLALLSRKEVWYSSERSKLSKIPPKVGEQENCWTGGQKGGALHSKALNRDNRLECIRQSIRVRFDYRLRALVHTGCTRDKKPF